jgi:hypothetical protein
MYTLETTIQVPKEHVNDLRHMLACDYLPLLRQRPGFRAALVLIDPDDHGIVRIMQTWESHRDAETFARTGALGAFIQQQGRIMPLAQVRTQGYTTYVEHRMPIFTQ